MQESKEIKLALVKDFLNNKGIFYIERSNGQLQIDTVSFWVTTEKFYDSKRNYKGQGLNAFMKYIKDNNMI